MRIGILGGTFNPPHLGHLHAAALAREQLSLDKVLFIPTGQPPHKSLPAGTATTAQRCEMVSLLLSQAPWASLCTIEAAREGASYTVDTLRALQAQYQSAPTSFFLIMGTDMLLSFEKWYRADEITQLCTLICCARDENEQKMLKSHALHLKTVLNAKVVLLQGQVLPISSTALRLGKGLDKTTPLVAQYIKQHRLYEK